jgi:hypothetical protein
MELLKDKLWLIKVPEIVYTQMLKEKELGVMDIYEVPSNTMEKEYEVNVNLSGKIDPKNFEVSYTKTSNFFSFKDKKAKPSKIKKIDYFGRFIATDERVSDMVTRKVAYDEFTSEPRIAYDDRKGRRNGDGVIELSVEQFRTGGGTMSDAIRRKQRKDKNLKKTRMDKEELKNLIFDLFNEQDYWTIKEIANKLDQPDNYLKSVLGEICDSIRSGPKKGFYELKRQYLKSKQDSSMKIDEKY